MCLTAPVRILTVEGDTATVAAGEQRLRASILPVPDARAGDWALMTAGTLVRVLDPDTASELAAAFHCATGASS